MLKLESEKVDDQACHYKNNKLKSESDVELCLSEVSVPVIDQLLERLAIDCLVVQLFKSTVEVLRCIGQFLESLISQIILDVFIHETLIFFFDHHQKPLMLDTTEVVA